MNNVVLVTIDAIRKDVFGCYGNNDGLTPFVDSLVDKCLVFTNAQSTGPYTQASFPGLLTSSYYLDYGRPRGLAPERTLISEPLREVGITTAAFHSNPHLCAYLGWNRGWDVFYDSMQDEVDEKAPYVKGHVINTKAMAWLSSHVERVHGPFFLWIHYMDIHEPYVPPRRYLELVEPSTTLNEQEMFALFQDVLLKRDVSDPEQVRLLKKLYDAQVREVDDYLSELFASLESLDVLPDTSVLITSDHGDEFAEHGGLSHDNKLYSELLDIPLLVYQSERESMARCHKLVSNIDVPPTVVKLCGLEPVEEFRGASLIPVEYYVPRLVFGEALDQKTERGGDIGRDSYFCRKDNLKLLYHAYLDTWEMYDLADDPSEQENIVDSSVDAAKLKVLLKPRVRRWGRNPA